MPVALRGQKEGSQRHHYDLEGAVERALGLGASPVEKHTVGEFSWFVIADPNGYEFCFSPGQ